MTALAEQAKAECPRLVGWLERHPVQGPGAGRRLGHDLLATVRWIDERQLPGMYLRQVDVPGVDTKFIEQAQAACSTELLDLQLDPAQDRPGGPGLRGPLRVPPQAGLRAPADRQSPAARFTELAVRADELAAPPPGVTRAYIVENEITYLAFPLAPDAIVIFGGGYAVDVLERLDWLADLDLVYWGDLDTHGFAILNRLRRRFPHARSILMDRETLLAHRSQWVHRADPDEGRSGPAEPGRAGPLPGISPRRLRSCGPPGAGAHQLRLPGTSLPSK